MARLRFAWRSLAKAPLLSLVVILSVGLGIGANTAIFSLFHQILLNSLPVERPEELVAVTSPGDFKGGRNSTNDAGGAESIFSYPMFRELEKHPQGLSGIAAFRTLGANLSFGKQSTAGTMLIVSGGYFPTLGVRPLVGRMLTREDDAGAGNAVAVLSYGYWTDRLGGESSVLNQPLRVNGQMFTVVGITPKGFTGTTLGSEPDIYVPLVFKPRLTPNWNGTDSWSDYWLYVIARPQHGVSRAQAEAALEQRLRRPAGAAIAHAAVSTTRSSVDRFLHSRLTFKDGSHGQSSMRDSSRTPLITLMAPTVLVLLIAMANAANLLLARSAQRRREMAIRAAMGAGRGELMGQMLTEALMLAAAGGIAGLAFAMVTLKLLITSLAGETPIHFLEAQLEWPVLLFGLGLSVVTGLLFGLYPAWEAARSSAAVTLKNESGQSSGTHGRGKGAEGAGVRAGDGIGGAADSDRAVPEEHGEPDARGPGDEDGERDRVFGVAGVERVQAGADARVIRAGGGGDGGHSGFPGRGRGAGAADCGQQLGQRREDRRRQGFAGQLQLPRSTKSVRDSSARWEFR